MSNSSEPRSIFCDFSTEQLAGKSLDHSLHCTYLVHAVYAHLYSVLLQQPTHGRDLFVFHITGIYAGLVGSAMLLSFARAILFFYVCVRAAKKLHNKMFTAVMRVPVRFFDVNPIGKCLGTTGVMVV